MMHVPLFDNSGSLVISKVVLCVTRTFSCPWARMTSFSSGGHKLFEDLYRIDFSVAVEIEALYDFCERIFAVVAFQGFFPEVGQG